MHKLRFAAAFALALALAAGSASGASFIVPTDRELVHVAKAIVIAKGVTSYCIPGDKGMIYTVYEMSVGEVIKGDVQMDQALRVVEPGGFIGQRGVAVPGAPVFRVSERALIFLDDSERGDWRTWSMVLGKFSFVRDLHGTRLLMRGQDEESIFGWDAAGNPHREPVRSEAKFLQFVRDEACGGVGDASYILDESTLVWRPKVKATVNGSGFHACDYASSVGNFAGACGAKWGPPPASPPGTPGIFDQPGGSGSVNFSVSGSQSGGVNGMTGVNAGMAAWNANPLSNVNLGIGAGSGSITFDDPNTTAPPLTGCGSAAVGCTAVSFSTPTIAFDGGTFAQIVSAAVSFKPGFPTNGSQAAFNQTACHELGHALGFRHSDQGTPTTSSAVMNSSVNLSSPIGANLQPWDTDAVQTMYNPNPGGAPCTAAGVPTGSANPPSINAGSSSTLSASATGTTPITFDWFIGSPGNTSTPAGTGASIMVSPSSTTTYWVRATGQCGSPQNSTAVTVTVTCTAPTVATQPQSQSIFLGSSALLSVTPAGSGPFTYQWFTGNTPGSGTPIGGQTFQSMSVSPTTTTSYWVQITGACGTVNSQVATVTVTCQNVSISQQPFANPPSITMGNSTTVTVIAGGSGPFSYQWFIGNSPNSSNPISGATGFQVTDTPPSTRTYWVRVSGQCGPVANSQDVTVTVTAACVNPSITQQPQSTTIAPGGTANLAVQAGGSGLTFQWFMGTPPFGTAISGATNSFLSVSPAVTTTYYVRVTGQCGQPIDSNPATVTISTSCIGTSITTQPGNVTVPLGSPASLSVVATGKAPLSYQWFRGTKGDTSNPVSGATSATLTTGPMTAQTRFWVHIQNECGQVDSNAATVNVTRPARGRAVRH